MSEKKQIHILFVADVGTEGGAAEALYELCKQLTETGEYRCTVLTSQHSTFNEMLEKAGTETVVTHHGAFLVPRPITWWKKPIKYLVCLARYLLGLAVSVKIAESAINFDEVDIIHTNVPRNDLGLILAKRHHIHHVVHLRECSFSHFQCWTYRHNPVNYLNQRTDAFIGVSNYVAKYWESLGIPKEKVNVVYDGIEIPNGVVRHRFSNKNGLMRILFLGGYVEAKGVWDAVRAIPLLLKKYPNDVMLDIFGNGSSETKRQIETYIKCHKLNSAVRLHGEIRDVWSIIPKYDIGVACSADEAFGRTVIEFQTCGVVPVVANSGAFRETVKDGTSGLTYEKSLGEKALAECISSLVGQPELMHRLSCGAFDSARHFTAKCNSDGVIAVYKLLLNRTQEN